MIQANNCIFIKIQGIFSGEIKQSRLRSCLSGNLKVSYKKLPEEMKLFPKTFSVQVVEGTEVVSVPRDTKKLRLEEEGIDIAEINGEIHNHKIVKLFGGKEFGDWDKLPIPENMSLYEAWHWMPLSPGEGLYKKVMSAASQVSSKDHYHQDGRPAFNQTQIDWMLTFIDHFTTVDVEQVRPYLRINLSGPAMIDTLAALTGKKGTIPTMPNIGNALTFLGKVVEGKPVSHAEMVEARKARGLDDPDNIIGKILGDDFVDGVFETLDPQPDPYPDLGHKKGKKKINRRRK